MHAKHKTFLWYIVQLNWEIVYENHKIDWWHFGVDPWTFVVNFEFSDQRQFILLNMAPFKWIIMQINFLLKLLL